MKVLQGIALSLALGLVAGGAIAKEKAAKQYAVVNEEVGVPVFAYDITDRPYTVVGEVKAGVRKATVFSKEASQAKIYRELWERAEKLGADAVVNAKYGDSHVSAFSWGKTNATGTAVKFTAPAEVKSNPGS
ncbi:YbjQ family protein [Sphingomonas lycopersici]|uniref:YbjQ family protein n=1 Tax=Sphingomonas lycopersici TaxID=2951807 RepID=A0AA41ZAJ8_9SPHN|nr:YbjQ family protein [Sphingomonas lycopersici]MCW6536018.1 YbjQ family protein [Sphingomonas lycopersici]